MRPHLHLAALAACAIGGLALATGAAAQSYGGYGYGGYAPSSSYGARTYTGAYVTSTYTPSYDSSRTYYGDGYGRTVTYTTENSYPVGYGTTYAAPTYSSPSYGDTWSSDYARPQSTYGYAPRPRGDDCDRPNRGPRY